MVPVAPRPFARLRVRTSLLIALALVPALALTLATADSHRVEALQEVRDDTSRAARLAALAEDRTFEGSREVLASLGWLVDLAAHDRAGCDRALMDLTNATTGPYSGFGLSDATGRVICSSRPVPAGFSVAGGTSFERAVATRKFAVGDYRINRITGVPNVGVGYPFYDNNGSLRAVASATIDLALLSERIAKADLGPGYVLGLADGNGTILARQPDHATWVGKSLPAEFMQAARAAPDQTAVTAGPDGVLRVYAFQVLHRDAQGGFVLLSVGLPVEAAFAPVDAAFNRSLLTLAVVGSLAFAFAWVASDRFVIRHLRKLSTAARHLANGDLGARTGVSHAAGEIGELAGAFDDMAASLQRSVAREQAARAELEAANARLEELDRFRSDFVHLAAHELNNPLTPIRLQAELLRSGRTGPLTPGQRTALEVLERNTARLSRLGGDMLDAARVQAGRLQLQPERIDLGAVVREALESFREAAARGNVTLDASLPEGLEVAADPDRVAQVLYNLLGNALKFTPPGGRVLVEVAREGGDAVVRVADTGAGFGSDEARLLFQPFSQLRGGREHGGTGLGLFVSRGIVEQHGGRIWAESAGPGHGATFAFRLPVVARAGGELPPADGGRASVPPQPPSRSLAHEPTGPGPGSA